MRRWMVQKNVPPDNVVTSTLIYWLGKNGMVCRERNLVDELERGFKPRCSSVSDDENSLGLESELEPAVTFKDNSGSPRKDCSSKVESCPLLGTFPERSGFLSMPGQTMPVKPFQLRSTCLSFGQPSNSLSILPVKLLLETLRKVRLPHIPGKFLSILP
uniref:Uncharacterized protein n=1 Tax=Oryza glumipatula TaxID=40148 RepID=A0A0E0ATX4_9ORYZ